MFDNEKGRMIQFDVIWFVCSVSGCSG